MDWYRRAVDSVSKKDMFAAAKVLGDGCKRVSRFVTDTFCFSKLYLGARDLKTRECEVGASA